MALRAAPDGTAPGNLAAWIYLLVGIACEVTGTTGMRALNESSPALSQLSATAGIVVSYFCVSRAVVRIQIGVAYAVWSGLGTAAVCLLSLIFFAEPMPPLKILGIFLVIAGMVVINLDHGGQGKQDAKGDAA